MKRKHFAVILSYAGLVFVVVSLLLYGFLGKSFQTLAIVHLVLAGLSLFFSLIIGGGRKVASDSRLPLASQVQLEGVYSFLYIVLFLGVVLFTGVLVKTYFPYRFDVTEEKVHSLSSHTHKVLDDLAAPVSVKVFSLGAEPPEKLRRLLDHYAHASKYFRWSAYDPDVNRTLVERLGVQEKDTLYFSFLNESDEDPKGILLSRNIDEEGLTNALIKLSRGRDTLIYVPQSHGEGSLSNETETGFSFLRESIAGEGYTVSEIDLIAVNEIPLSKSLLLILSPQKDFLPGEKEKIKNFLSAGGSALFLLEPLHVNIVRDIIEPLGIFPGKDTIVDREAFTFKDGVMGVQPLIDTFSSHPSARDFGKTVLLSTAVSVRKSAEADAVTEIAFTSETSWAETNLQALYSDSPTAEKTEDDIPGPVSIAAAYENAGRERPEDSMGRVIVLGDMDFVSNVNIRQLFNRDFFLNMLNWVSGEDEVVKIRAGTLQRSRQVITPEQFTMIFTWAGVIIPEIILLLGIAVWVSRR